MYIANKAFTSKHKHNYEKGQRITNARYFFLSTEDKPNFDYQPNSSYESDQEEDPNYGHTPDEYYTPASDVATRSLIGVIEETAILTAIDDSGPSYVSPDPSFNSDPTPDSVTDNSSQDFGGGDSGGGGASDSY